jgi:hypothetical protein
MDVRYEEAQITTEHDSHMGYEVYQGEVRQGFITRRAHGWLCFPANSQKRFTASSRQNAARALIKYQETL